MEKIAKKKVALVTGAAGFIGFHISLKLLEEGWRVIGLDCLSDYYEVSLKKDREKILLQKSSYRSVHGNVESSGVILNLFKEERPETVIHLAGQAGVRHSISNPRPYLESNILGTFEIVEAARLFPPKHTLIASTSSVYGANEVMPYKEVHRSDHQISFYAATKKCTENIAHSYSHLFNLPITMIRFFTVYGPWGRPDMALFKFTNAILNNKKINVYNFGDMSRDFTYVDDLVKCIRLLIDIPPLLNQKKTSESRDVDTLSPVAPFRTVNIGNSKPEKLEHFLEILEELLGRKAIKNLLPIQPGDLPTTWADTGLLKELTGYQPNTPVREGVSKFIKWYKDYYKIL